MELWTPSFAFFFFAVIKLEERQKIIGAWSASSDVLPGFVVRVKD